MKTENSQGQNMQEEGTLLDVFQQTSNHFDLGRITTYEPLGGNMNKNYLVTTNNRQFIFKFPKKHSRTDLEAETVYLNRLKEHNFPAAYYINGSDGSPFFEYNNDVIMAQPRLVGIHPPFSADVCFSIGRNIATLHQIPNQDLPERDHWLKESFLSQNITLIQTHLPDKAQRFATAFDSLSNIQYANLATTIVHGDLFENNCLYDGNNLVAILDWEEVGIAPAVLDLATCIFNFCFEDNTFHPELYTIMLNGYQSNRKLNDLEKETMNLALQYVALNLSAWRLVQFGIRSPDPTIAERHEIYWDIGLDNFQLPIV